MVSQWCARVYEWLANGVQEYTEQGNLKPPPRKLIVEWITNAWDKLSDDIIKRSFKACALNLNVDGSENSCIHCFKPDQPCAAGYEKLQQQLHVLQDGTSNANPFFNESDIEDAAQDINLIDMDNDEDEVIDIE